jgi:hypothetical protein
LQGERQTETVGELLTREIATQPLSEPGKIEGETVPREGKGRHLYPQLPTPLCLFDESGQALVPVSEEGVYFLPQSSLDKGQLLHKNSGETDISFVVGNHRVEDMEQLIKQGLSIGERRESRINRAPHFFTEEEHKDLFLVFEVQKEGASADVCALSNLAGGSGLEALASEEGTSSFLEARQFVELIAFAAAKHAR